MPRIPTHHVQPVDELAAQFKEFHKRINSLERASTSGTTGGGGTGGTPATTVTTQAVGDAPVVGVSTKYAREDHKHGRESFGNVVGQAAFGAAAANGTALTLARADHVHGTPVHDAAAHSTIPLNSLAIPTAPINMGGFTVQNVGTPVNPNDAANKSYVDNMVAGLSWKDSVRCHSANANNNFLAGLNIYDGVQLVDGDRILLKDQSTPTNNGIWVAHSGAWVRATDADTGTEMLGAAVFVEEGTIGADTAWVCTTNAPITLGTTPLTFAQFSGGGSVTAGAGMTQAGNTLNVIGDATMVIGADIIGQAPLTGDVTTVAGSPATTIANDAVTNAKLANMPAYTIKGNGTSGVQDPTDLSLTALVNAFGLVRKMSTFANAALSTVVTHNFNTQNVSVTVWHFSTAPYEEVECDVEHTSNNTVTVRFAVAPAATEYIVVVIG